MTDSAKMKRLAESAGSVAWKWWDSNSTLRLTTELNGRHGADGDAISAHRDSVQCPGVFREFVEAVSPAAVLELLAERDSLAFLLKRFVDGEHDQGENQSERHMYHDEAEALLAYLGGEVQGHTLVPDDILRKQYEQRMALIAENEALRKDAARYQWLRDKSESVHPFYLSTPIWFTGVRFRKVDVDSSIDAAMISVATQSTDTEDVSRHEI